MKALILLSTVFLASCAHNIAGLTLQERLRIYGIAAGLYGAPIEITLEGPEPK